MNSGWKLIAVLAMFSGLGSANIDLPKYQNKIDRQKTRPLCSVSIYLATAKMYMFCRTCVRHGKPGKVWNMIRFFYNRFLCIQFYKEIQRADQEMHTMNTKLEESARPLVIVKLRGRFEIISLFDVAPEIGFWAYFGGCLWCFRGESALRPRVFFWLIATFMLASHRYSALCTLASICNNIVLMTALREIVVFIRSREG